MDIESSCKLDMSSNDTADVAACEKAGKDLFAEVDDCIKPSKTLIESCTCFMGLSTDNLDKVKSCDIKSKNTMVTEAKKNCTNGIKYSDKMPNSLPRFQQVQKGAGRRGGDRGHVQA